MMRLLAAIILLLALILPVGAEDAPTLYSAADFDADSVTGALPDELRDALPEDIFSPEGFSEKFSYEYFASLIGKAARTALSPALTMTARTMGLVLISAAIGALRGMVKSDSLASLFEFVSGLCLMLTVYQGASELFSAVSVYLTQLSGIVTAMAPVMLAIGTAGGNLSSAAVSHSGLMLGLALVETLAAKALYPVLQLCFGLAAVSGMGSGLRLEGIAKLVRDLFSWILGLAAAIISAIMSFQTAITAKADSLSMRAVRFAASKAIPVAGGIASDAMGAVAGSLSLVRSTVGVVGVILIAALTLPVILRVLLIRLGVVISGTAAEILGLERERRLLSEMAGLLGFLGAVCIIAALMFVYALTVFAKTAAALA
ncbi:MAG: hypothetical protein E7632_11635 [Ruminococcaceae bacterium]|nr:hypothetical protein [Oscillospiraceae bacterium]